MSRWVLGPLLVALLLTPVAARADTDLRTRVILGAVASTGTQRATFDVPAGTTPVALTGRLTANGQLEGVTSLFVGERVAAEITADDPRTVDVPLAATDVQDGQINIGLRYDPVRVDDKKCRVPETANVTLEGITLRLAGDPTPPTTVGNFFAPGVNEIAVVIAEGSPDDVLKAGLAAVGALSHRYDDRAKIRLATAASLKSPMARTVAIKAGTGDVTAKIEASLPVPTLTLTGEGDGLAAAAAAFGSDSLALADASGATRLSENATPKESLSRTLLSLGSERVQLGGYGRSSGYVQASQADFGGPVSALEVTLTGQTSDIPKDVDAILSIYWNDFLIGSRALTDPESLNWRLKVSKTLLRSGNGMTMQVDAIPRDGDCLGIAGLPIRVDIDGRASTIKATRGSSGDAGFAQFPQVLGGHLPVALAGSGRDRTTQAIDASRIVASLQRATRTPLAIDLVSSDKLASGSESGLLVGADGAAADKLKAPLRFAAFRQISGNSTEFGVETTQPFAALEAFRTGDRNVLMLGGWQSGSEKLATKVANYVESRSDGWGSLSGDIVVMSAKSTDATTLASTTLVPQEDVADDFRGYAKWVLSGLLGIVLIGLAGVFVERRRRNAIRAYVDAQEADDGEAHIAP